jgi:TfoX/Sxy family transcriptional regulator of competence genes
MTAFNQDLAQRVQKTLEKTNPPGLTLKKMFGGIGYLIRGNMACGVHGDGLIVRVHPDNYLADLERPFTRVFDLTGKVMKGWLVVDLEGVSDDDSLKAWIDESVSFAKTLPAK